MNMYMKLVQELGEAAIKKNPELAAVGERNMAALAFQKAQGSSAFNNMDPNFRAAAERANQRTSPMRNIQRGNDRIKNARNILERKPEDRLQDTFVKKTDKDGNVTGFGYKNFQADVDASERRGILSSLLDEADKLGMSESKFDLSGARKNNFSYNVYGSPEDIARNTPKSAADDFAGRKEDRLGMLQDHLKSMQGTVHPNASRTSVVMDAPANNPKEILGFTGGSSVPLHLRGDTPDDLFYQSFLMAGHKTFNPTGDRTTREIVDAMNTTVDPKHHMKIGFDSTGEIRVGLRGKDEKFPMESAALPSNKPIEAPTPSATPSATPSEPSGPGFLERTKETLKNTKGSIGETLTAVSNSKAVHGAGTYMASMGVGMGATFMAEGEVSVGGAARGAIFGLGGGIGGRVLMGSLQKGNLNSMLGGAGSGLTKLAGDGEGVMRSTAKTAGDWLSGSMNAMSSATGDGRNAQRVAAFAGAGLMGLSMGRDRNHSRGMNSGRGNRF